MSNILKTLAAGSVSGEYQISRSLRFNSADSAYLNRTPASASNRRTFTWSAWVKRGALGSFTTFFSGVSTGTVMDYLSFDADGKALISSFNSVDYIVRTKGLLRDPSAWYHIIIAFDSTQATPTNRVKIYVNGVDQTDTTGSYPTPDYDTQINNNVIQYVGYNQYNYWDGYLAEINFIDGQALDPTSFGEANETTGVWSPIEYTGSYGTNGFYLNFSDNSDVTATTLGKDQAGSNNWTPSGSPGFSVTAGAGNDSLVDTPTQYGTDTGAGGEVRGNYATFNPTAVSGMGLATLANGNLNASGDGTLFKGSVSTIAMSTGKWYWETTIVGGGNTYGPGIVASTSLASAIGGSYGYTDASDAWMRSSNGVVYSGGAGVVTGLSTFTTDDVISIAVDFDAGKLWFAKNGTWDSSGNPATGANPTITFSPGGKSFYAMVQGWVYAPYTWTMALNAGQRPFAYTAPSGFKALVTTNLPDPTVVQGDDYFNTVLWEGDGSNPRGITGVGFQPDFVWLKNRSAGWGHRLSNAVVGANYALETNNTNAELFQNQYGYLNSFNSDGFTVTAGSTDDYFTNNSGDNYVAWNWKADGAGSVNELGTISSTVSANTIAGISIVTYTGSSASTVGHGLGVAPAMIIAKQRNNVEHWVIYHQATGKDAVLLFTTNAVISSANYWGSGGVTSTVFGTGGVGAGNAANNIVAYCFAEVEGFSKFGSYTGNGSADGPFVYTGFRPAFVMIKNTTTAHSWIIYDTARNTYNVMGERIYPNSSSAESTLDSFDIVSNGFKIRFGSGLQETNETGSNYIYMAFAENPFKYSLAR
jgi:hypothetical protein